MFRVTVQGKFHDLSPAQRATLTRGSDMAQMAFTEQGTFTCDVSASVFTFRCSVAAGPDVEEWMAVETALEALAQQGYAHTVLRERATDLNDIKVRRKSR